jgi:hypothetical protein
MPRVPLQRLIAKWRTIEDPERSQAFLAAINEDEEELGQTG